MSQNDFDQKLLVILLLETPCPLVGWLVTFFTPSACAMDQPLWISGRASTGAWVTLLVYYISHQP